MYWNITIQIALDGTGQTATVMPQFYYFLEAGF